MARAYRYITSKTSPNQNARNSKIKSITIHHWGSRGQKFDNVVSWLCDKRAGTSAHYVAEAGKVACIVDPDRRAWHAGSSRGNHESIGIECRPEATEGDYATVAALVADLRSVYGNLPLVPHRYWTNTACPGVWDLAKIDRLARGLVPSIPHGGASVGGSRPASSNVWDTSPRIKGMSKSDVVTVQNLLVGAGYSVGSYGADGSYKGDTVSAVREAQEALGVAVDGIAGPDTVKALKAAQKTASKPAKVKRLKVDGRFGSSTVKALQQWLNEKHGAGLKVDKKAGHSTWKALQKALGTPADGKVSNQSYKADELGNGITQGWDYDGRGAKGSTMVRHLQVLVGATPDGVWGEGTSTALQRFLNREG